jgi:hypothetical protein
MSCSGLESTYFQLYGVGDVTKLFVLVQQISHFI